jgi:hypothetical protein
MFAWFAVSFHRLIKSSSHAAEILKQGRRKKWTNDDLS